MAAKKKKQALTQFFQQELGGDLNHEIHQLIDLAVRKQFGLQQFVQRFSNTNYFAKKFPGLLEKNGTISDQLLGVGGLGVSPGNLQSAIKNYGTALEKFQTTYQDYGLGRLNKDMFASALKNQTSATEFAARVQAIYAVDTNPALKDALSQQAKAEGLKGNDLYKLALRDGAKFTNAYEAAQYQTQLGFGAKEANKLAQGGPAANDAGAFQGIDQVIAEVRQNLSSYGPELQAQGINPAQLVKILNNPGSFASEMQKITQIATSRKSQFGRPVPGTYAQKGTGGGLSLYDQEGTAAYG